MTDTAAPLRHDLPEDVWAAAGLPDTASVLAEADALADAFAQWNGAPRDPALVTRFCRTLPAGRVLLCGAGSLSHAILDQLPPGITVVGIIDRMGATVGTFRGLPVVTADQTAGLQWDYVLLAHNAYEMEMLAALVAAGVPAQRVIAVHADARFREMCRPVVQELAGHAGRRPFDAAVVSANTSIIDDRQLAAWLPPERTIQLFLGRARGELDQGGPYETIDLRESLDALRLVLSQQRPRVVYVRSVIYKNYLGMLIKRWLPQATVIQEFYDYTTLWPDADLANLFGLNATSIAWLRRAELIAAQTLDLMVSKRGGAQWPRFLHRCRTPYRLVFPQVDDGAGPAAGPPQGDLVYAGFLPAPAFLRTFPVGYNFLPLMEEVCHQGGLTADIFNASHHAGGDALFAEYLQRYQAPPIVYRRRVAYADLLDRLKGYRFGWLCNDQRTFHADREVGICNRWTGYVSAGLPVLLDKSWGFMGKLTREYGAGITLERLEATSVVEAVRGSDQPALAAGARRLREHLLNANRSTFDHVGSMVERGLECGVDT